MVRISIILTILIFCISSAGIVSAGFFNSGIIKTSSFNSNTDNTDVNGAVADIPFDLVPSSKNQIANSEVAIILLLSVIVVILTIISFNLYKEKNKKLSYWYDKIAKLENKKNFIESIINSHNGLVIVWERKTNLEKDWGEPHIFGSSSAFASFIIMDSGYKEGNLPAFILNKLSNFPLHEFNCDTKININSKKDEYGDSVASLGDKIRNLNSDGSPFSGFIVTNEGREIEVFGRISGKNLILWFSDPVSNLVNENGFVSALHEKSKDLYGSHAFIENLPYPAWLRNSEAKITWANKAYVNLVGANIQDVLKKQIEIDNSNSLIFAKKVLKENKEISKKIKTNVNGSIKTFLITENPLGNSANSDLGGVAIDITNIEKLREDIELLKRTTSKMLNSIKSAVAIFNYKQELDYYNEAFQKLWSFNDAKLIARMTHSEFLDDLYRDDKLPELDDYNKFKNKFLDLYDATNEDYGSFQDGGIDDQIWLCPNGQTLCVSCQRHPEGGVVMVFEDITEKHELNTRYNTLITVQESTLNRLAEGVCVFGMDGKLQLFNNAFKDLFDYKNIRQKQNIEDITQLIKKYASKHYDDLENIKAKVVSIDAEERSSIDRVMHLDDDRYISITTEPLIGGATLLAFLDITDTMKKELDLQSRNAFLEDVDRMKSKFIAFLSYHLRTPLNSIIGFAEMLDKEIIGKLNEHQKDYTSSILMASNQLLDMSNDIIDLSVIDAGKMELNKGNIDIRKLMEKATEHAILKAADTEITLKMDCPKNIGILYGDEHRIRQVIFNLLSNAFSVSNPGDDITYGAVRVEEALFIYVSASRLNTKRLEDVFSQNNNLFSDDKNMIGLSLVKSIVELHGGEVSYTSDEDADIIFCKFPTSSTDFDPPTKDKKIYGSMVQNHENKPIYEKKINNSDIGTNFTNNLEGKKRKKG